MTRLQSHALALIYSLVEVLFTREFFPTPRIQSDHLGFVQSKCLAVDLDAFLREYIHQAWVGA